MLTLTKVLALQILYDVNKLQTSINNGTAWINKTSYNIAMNSLTTGECMLPTKRCIAYNNTKIPSRTEFKPGTKGTLLNGINYWQSYYNLLK